MGRLELHLLAAHEATFMGRLKLHLEAAPEAAFVGRLDLHLLAAPHALKCISNTTTSHRPAGQQGYSEKPGQASQAVKVRIDAAEGSASVPWYSEGAA